MYQTNVTQPLVSESPPSELPFRNTLNFDRV